MCSAQAQSALGQKRTLVASVDHLVGAGEQRCRQAKAECLCRLDVDHQVELGWRLHRQVGRLLALKDAIDVGSGTPVVSENSIRPR